MIRADLPGVSSDTDIEIYIAHDVLHIGGDREVGPEPRDHPSDLRDGSFVRDIGLLPGTREDEVSAAYGGGILEVRVPIGRAVRWTRGLSMSALCDVSKTDREPGLAGGGGDQSRGHHLRPSLLRGGRINQPLEQHRRLDRQTCLAVELAETFVHHDAVGEAGLVHSGTTRRKRQKR